MSTVDSKKLQTRDFVSVGIYSVLYIAVTLVAGAVAHMIPVTFLFKSVFAAFFSGPVFMLFTAKIPKRGAVSLLGCIVAILMFVSGHYWLVSVIFLVFGILADLICSSGQNNGVRICAHAGFCDENFR